jgi:hypothetical protein
MSSFKDNIQESVPYIGAQKKIAVVIDPYSTGCCVAQEIQKRGYLLIAVWTIGFAEEMKSHVPRSCGRMDYFAEIDQADTLEESKARLVEAAKGREIFCCFAGGEAGTNEFKFNCIVFFCFVLDTQTHYYPFLNLIMSNF